ncbi:Phenylacetate-coenzyme A ligase [bioreactor metagenome]|uniref:Phenylacetate-coenzyme A ligase n=1 Tax=bioreactor metagenome TaxID=1076179 RepID=A0A644UDT2_9ZZZZ|nr:AMP-binding protein [Desulfovibrio desulfuricans]MEA4989293.1 AMP-binding protein [Desulfovibrio desulfuricans]
MANAATQPSIAGFGSCPLDLWLARQCGARSSGELPGRLAIAQTALLRSTLRQAVRGAFYAARLRECKLDITSVGDLERLPFTTAEDLRNWGDFLCVSQGDVQRMVTLHTSGTTGQPKRLAFTDADLARTRDFFAVGMSQLVGAGQRLAVLLPGAERPDGVADLLRQALGAAGVDVLAPPPEVHATPSPDADPCAEPGKALAQWLEQAKPHCLVAAPAQLALLLKHFPHRGPQGLAGILTSAEPLDDALGLALRRAWQCEILDHYGLTETAYGCAVECPAHQGFHVRELDVLIEIVDISGCKILAPGEEGEVVITTLQRQAMPLVRYRTGDVACLLPAPCACGSPLRRLGPVRGRIERKSGQPPRIVRPAKGRGV